MADEKATGKSKTGAVVDPFRNYRFRLQVGDEQAAFTECTGVGLRIHPIRYAESGAGHVVRALPGPVEYAEVTLRYGLTTAAGLWLWLTKTAAGQVERRNVSIVMLQVDGTLGLQWDLLNAWPCEWRGAPLDALGREAAIEEIHLAYDTLKRVP